MKVVMTVTEETKTKVEAYERIKLFISDVDKSDAVWFKNFADQRFYKHQNEVISFFRHLIEGGITPLIDNVISQQTTMQQTQAILFEKIVELEMKWDKSQGLADSEDPRAKIPAHLRKLRGIKLKGEDTEIKVDHVVKKDEVVKSD